MTVLGKSAILLMLLSPFLLSAPSVPTASMAETSMETVDSGFLQITGDTGITLADGTVIGGIKKEEINK